MNKTTFNEQKYAHWVVGSGDIVRIDQIVRLSGSGNDILDIGCGTGAIGKRLMENGNRVWGLDISSGAVKRAKQAGINAKVCDIEKEEIPFAKKKFDGIILAEIIEHVFDTDALLERIVKRIKPGGFLIVTTPNIATLGRRLLLMAGKNPLIEVHAREHTAGHIRYFVKDTVLPLLTDHGLTIEYFGSDVVNFNASGSIRSILLAKMLPTLGKSLIVKARKKAAP